MGITKTDIFSQTQNELASITKVLGHPARIAILQHIIATKACICGDLVNEIGLAQPTISQHLKELKNIGIIQGTIEGTSVCYCINTNRWTEIKTTLEGFFNLELTNSNCC
ncbi:metalloregulator ArsR/SmtB family transcription factor [Bacteroidia bacterium]|jgi:ArsR family transcriptional regulator|nr:metalloregulator ArsR/SmtB family transcription factor [Bacteroidia bacterium]